MNPFRFFVLRLTFLLPPVMVAAQGGSLFSLSAEGEDYPLKKEIMQVPEKMGSIYYAYPTPHETYTPTPDGYTPCYISHYGRHGSRWLTADDRYTVLVSLFDSLHVCNGLTTKGEEVRLRLHEVWQHAEGMGGMLTPLGARQHHDIACRMAEAYPRVFADSARIRAVSSTSQRCIMSMAAFCEGLKEQNPKLRVDRNTGARFMKYLHYALPEQKALESDSAAWRSGFAEFQKSKIQPKRFLKNLFRKLPEERFQRKIMEGIYWIAEDMQNTEQTLDFFDLFTRKELFGIWETINYRMYVCNAASPTGKMAGPRSAAHLLNDIIAKADSALAHPADPSADLRFGHDTDLIRLVTRMQLSGCANRESNPDRCYIAWQDFQVSPMAGNVQVVFYRHASTGHILVKILLNEREMRLPLHASTAPYYSWDEVKRLWSKQP